MSDKCPHFYRDGSGEYCRLIARPNKDYPHEHWRVFCYANQDSIACDAKKRNLSVKP